jgi:hypothetical protein
MGGFKVDGGRNMLRIGLRSDAYDAGRNEDGDTVIEEIIYLMAEDADGFRWIGPCVADTGITNDSVNARGSRARKAAADVLRLYVRALHDGDFDPRDAWEAGRPCYGSPAYETTGGDAAWQDN